MARKYSQSFTLRQPSPGRPRNPGKLLAVINIDVAPDCRDKIYIHEFDDDETLARNFQKKHNLQPRAFEILFAQIRKNRQQVVSNQPQQNNHNKSIEKLPTAVSESPTIAHPNSFYQRDERTRILTQPNNNDYSPQLMKYANNEKQTYSKPNLSSSRYSQKVLTSQNTYRTLQDEAADTVRDIGEANTSRAPPNQNSRLRSSLSSRSPLRTIKTTSRLYNSNLLKEAYVRSIEKRVSQPLSTQQVREQAQLKECTHAPNINTISRLLASNRRATQVPIEKYLQQQGQVTNKRKQFVRSKAQQEELSKFSFRPSINPVSQKLVENRPTSTYDKALRRDSASHKQLLLEHQLHARKPTLNSISEQIMAKKSPFMVRLRQYEEDRNTRLNQLYKQVRRSQVVDPLSGRPLFQPQLAIDDQYLRQRNTYRKNKDIGAYLHEMGQNKGRGPSLPQEPTINEKSEEIVKVLQAKRVAWLFGQLDSDQDGLISATKITIDTVPEQILEIVMPILFEMEQFNFELNLDQFKEAVQALHKALTCQQKAILYNYSRSKAQQPKRSPLKTVKMRH